MAVAFKKAVDDNVPWDQRLANYAGNKDAGKSEYQRALEVYRGKSALGDTEGANQAKKWSDQVNTAIGGIGDNIVSNRTDQLNKATDTIGQKVNAAPFEFKQTNAPFQYNAQADPSYQAALREAKLNTQTAAGNTSAAMNARGIMDSTITTDRVGQQAQQQYGHVSDTILPQLMQQAYGRYQDQNNNDYRTQLANYNSGQDQMKNLTGYAGTLSGLNQQEADNAYKNSSLAEAIKSGNWNAYKDSVAMTGNTGNGPMTDWSQLGGQGGSRTLQGQTVDTQRAAEEAMAKYREAEAARQTALANGQIGVSRQSNNNYATQNLMSIWDRTGKAPAGIPGVAEGTPLSAKPTSLTPKISPKESADNYNLILGDLSTKGVTKDQAIALVQANRDSLSDADYKAAMDHINKEF